jgi:hypothetical protein
MNLTGALFFDKDGLSWSVGDYDDEEDLEGSAEWLLFAEEKVGQVLVFATPAGYKRLTLTIEDAELEHDGDA